MAVEWSTIEAIARTQAIDLWLLVPLGTGVNRLLKRNGPPSGAWADRLTLFFGTDEWKARFYRPRQQSSQTSMFDAEATLIDAEGALEKGTSFAGISDYFIERLNTIFAKTVDNPLQLFNSKNSPIYLLCFASANPKGSKTAVKIAGDILGK
jgi:three-Cys-motif partner protein